MRYMQIAAAAALVLCGSAVVSANNNRAAVNPLAGVWTAPVYEVPLRGDFDVAVWGPDVSRRREVNLAVEASGEGTLTVRTSVVDSRGRAKPYSMSIEEAHVRIEMPERPSDGRAEPTVTVLSAERRYPGDPKDRWPLDGLKVRISAVASDANRLNIMFETPEGRGSFGESLIRRERAVAQAVQ